MNIPAYTNWETAEQLRGISIQRTENDGDTLAPPSKTYYTELKIPTREQLKRVDFPGLPYVPGPFYLSEMKNVQRTVANEVIDFLDSVKDLIKLLLIVKTKHLRSPVPIPGDVLREIHYMGDKKGDTRMRNFERKIFGKSDIVPTVTTRHSLTSETGFMGASNTSASLRSYKPSAHNSVDTCSKSVDSKEFSKTKNTPAWLSGRKTKPIWQTVENSLDEQRFLNERIIANHRRMLKEKVSMEQEFIDLMKNPYHIDDPSCRRITNELLPKIKSRDPSFRKQIEMFKAYAGGFESLKDYKKYLENSHEHWFKDLLKQSLEVGVVITQDVVLAYERLGQYHDVNFEHIEQARAKMCLIVQSLPIWDISRATVQRGLDFVLRNILKLPLTDMDISKWLDARRLVRLVFPPAELEAKPSGIMSKVDIPRAERERRRGAIACQDHGELRVPRLHYN